MRPPHKGYLTRRAPGHEQNNGAIPPAIRFSIGDRLSRPGLPGGAARRAARGIRNRSPLYPAPAEDRETDVGAHQQLRTARLGDRRSRLSLSAPASRKRTSVAADAADRARSLAGARRLPAP